MGRALAKTSTYPGLFLAACRACAKTYAFSGSSWVYLFQRALCRLELCTPQRPGTLCHPP